MSAIEPLQACALDRAVVTAARAFLPDPMILYNLGITSDGRTCTRLGGSIQHELRLRFLVDFVDFGDNRRWWGTRRSSAIS